MKLIDSHCHFDFPVFDQDRADLWQQCADLGVKHIIMPGVDPSLWRHSRDLCQRYPGLYFSAGVHPYWIESCQNRDVLEHIPQALASPYCIALGESGLDGTISTPMERQLQLLEWHMRCAVEHQLPLILHSVKAHNELLRAAKKYPGLRGVIHGFSGSYDMAMQWIELGFYLGIGGTITYTRAQKTRRAVAQVPLEYLLLETDAPDMPLAGHQGEYNSPLHLIRVAKTLAQLKGIKVEDVAQQTSDNSRQLFGLTETM